MNHDQQHDHETGSHGSRGKWVFIGFLLVAGFFLWAEHRAHLMGALPYLLILACPLMHLFHHGHGRGHRAAHRGEVGGEPRNPADKR